MTKKKIKLSFTDFYPGPTAEELFFRNMLETEYEIVDSDKPDFIIYSLFGHNHLNYDCVRIFYTGENVRPNFNVCDYAYGFDWMTFEDRNYRLPYYRHQASFKALTSLPEITASRVAAKKFGNFVYSNGSASTERGDFFELMNAYRHVDSGGRYKNNMGSLVDDKMQFMGDYKFSISFENVSTSGYTTEKIVDAKVAGTVPVYWGNKNIAKDFNSRSFVNCHDFSTFAEVIEFVKYLDNNQEAYLEMANQPLFTDNQVPGSLTDDAILKSLVNIIEQGPVGAKRRCGLLHERFVERDLKLFHDIKNNPIRYLSFFLNNINKKIKSVAPKSTAIKPRVVE